jgi:cyclophilin family peptidyl-prolyl cis-trans isomerase
MATAGRDTGGCQFFINTAANLHLDGRYTLFAQVLKGMDVVDKIEVGDRILSASIL